jgi:hypothetical protein
MERSLALQFLGTNDRRLFVDPMMLAHDPGRRRSTNLWSGLIPYSKCAYIEGIGYHRFVAVSRNHKSSELHTRRWSGAAANPLFHDAGCAVLNWQQHLDPLRG